MPSQETPSPAVRDVMSQAVAVRPNTSVREAREILLDHRFSSLPVVDVRDRPVGIVTATDLLEDQPIDQPVRAIMSQRLRTVGPGDPVGLAARAMRQHRIHHLVVVEGERPVGLVSSFDLLRLLDA